jgi:FKBP-type peptidyl-prolyl cis-trans isomerase SlyD
MQITNGTVVSFHYVLKDDDGQVLDSSEGGEPLSYLHGAGAIIPGLEQELAGKQVGDELLVAVAPQDAYGERNEALRQDVSREQFAGIEDLHLGMQFQVESESGDLLVTIVEMTETLVTVDGNHPLAGVRLNFAVAIKEVREASEEELAQGHARTPR